MVKPILVILYNTDGLLSQFTAINIANKIKDELKDDYYVLLLPTEGHTDIKVFFEKDFNIIKYEDLLKKIIKFSSNNIRIKLSNE